MIISLRNSLARIVHQPVPLGVLVHKGFRYRVYPTDAQVRRIGEWEGALRFLWNLAHEQRLIGLRRTNKRYPTAFDQINELTALRAELPWLADVPRNVCAQLLVELDKAWQRCFKRTARAPRWKKRGGGYLGMTEPHPQKWRLDGTTIRFPKLGMLRAVIHRPLEGTPKSCTLKRDGDQWFVSISCVIERPDPPQRVEPIVAIDRGITNLLADSNDRLVPNPKHFEKALARLARAQRVVARRKKGSRNQGKARLRVARIHRKVRRQREYLLHQLSHDYAKSHGTVVVENLNVQGMIRSASGSVAAPGRNVSQKRGLNRNIAGAAWGRFGEMLRYKLEWSGGQFVEVAAAYSSQTCSRCGHVDAASRQGERFCCTSCGYIDHADINAAKVLKSRANRSALPVEGSPLEGPPRSRKLKVKLRVPRCSTSEGCSR